MLRFVQKVILPRRTDTIDLKLKLLLKTYGPVQFARQNFRSHGASLKVVQFHQLVCLFDMFINLICVLRHVQAFTPTIAPSC